MSRVLYRCRTCFEQGNERTFRTIDGFREHLVNYHGAKKTDLITIASTGKESGNGRPAEDS